MKWAYTIRRKGSAALLLSVIFALIFTKNVLDNKNVSKLGSSFSSVYEDRLLVESYIYRMSEQLFRKKITIDTLEHASASAVKSMIAQYNESINGLIQAYEITKLTEAESRHFAEFKKHVTALMAFEREYFVGVEKGLPDAGIKQRIDEQFNHASNNLDLLSAIQISEGKILNEYTQKLVAGSFILSQFEIAVLIAIGLLIIVLVFESRTIFSNVEHRGSLN